MKNKLITLIVASLTLGVCAADHHSKDGKHKAKPAKADGKRKLPPHMAKFDKNKDGKLCDAEKATAKAAWVKNAQKNKGKGKKKPAPKGGKKPAPKKG